MISNDNEKIQQYYTPPPSGNVDQVAPLLTKQLSRKKSFKNFDETTLIVRGSREGDILYCKDKRSIGSGAGKSVFMVGSGANGQVALLRVKDGLKNKERKGAEKRLKQEEKYTKFFIEHGVPYISRVHTYRNKKQKEIIATSDLCEGDLEQCIRTESLTIDEKIRLVFQTAQALFTMHNLGYCHLDIKPENLLVKRCSDGSSEIRVIDFEYVGKIGKRAAPRGTPSYVAPELLEAIAQHIKIRVSPHLDIFSFGATLYEIFRRSIEKEQLFPVQQGEDGMFCPQMDAYTVFQAQESLRQPIEDGDDRVNSIRGLTAQCISYDNGRRPSMETVVEELRPLSD